MSSNDIKIAVILEAAGNAERFGSNKLLHPLKEGRPMVSLTLDKVREVSSHFSFGENKKGCPCNIIISKVLVTQYEEVAALAPDFKIMRNYHPEWGISHSMQLGIEAAGEVDAYMFCVCDQPWLRASSIIRMIDVYAEAINDSDSGSGSELGLHSSSDYNSRSEPASHFFPIVSLAWQSSMYNPKIFSSVYKEELLALSGDIGGRQIINRRRDELLLVEAESEAEITDIDALEDLMESETLEL